MRDLTTMHSEKRFQNFNSGIIALVGIVAAASCLVGCRSSRSNRASNHPGNKETTQIVSSVYPEKPNAAIAANAAHSHSIPGPGLSYLHYSVAEAKRKQLPICVHFKVDSDFTAPDETGKPVRNRSVTTYMYATDGARIRFDTTSGTGNQTRRIALLWDGKECITHFMRPGLRKTSPDELQAVELSGPDSQLRRDAKSFENWTCSACLGTPLEVALLERGDFAKREGGLWTVRLHAPLGAPDKASYEIVTIREDRGFRPDSWTLYDGNGVPIDSRRVTKWRRVGNDQWLPEMVEESLNGVIRGRSYCEITQASIGTTVSRDTFILVDNPAVPVFDNRSNRVVRRPKMVIRPVTEERLDATYRAICLMRQAPPQLLQTEPPAHDNGARVAPGLCGIECVWLMTRLSGQNASWKEMEKRFPSKDGTHSMRELRDLAHEHKIELVGLKVPKQKLRDIPCPFILYMQDRYHFCVVTQVSGSNVLVYDPPAKSQWIPVSTLERVWGKGYLLSPATASVSSL